MVSIQELIDILASLEAEGEKPDLKGIQDSIREAVSKLDFLKVSGKENLDKLYGCILALEMLAGDAEEVNVDGR